MLYILDPNLTDYVGHHLEYARSIAEAAAGQDLECEVLANKKFNGPELSFFSVQPVYELTMWSTLPGKNFHSNDNLKWSNAAFARDTLNYFERRPLSREDIVFIPTIVKAQLSGAADVIEKLGNSDASFHIMLRYQADFLDGELAQAAFSRLEQLSSIARVTLCTDSHRLVKLLAPLTKLPIRVYPIPHVPLDGAPSTERGPICHIVSLGNARGEKGIAEIFSAILASRDKKWFEKVRFTIQANNPSDDAVEPIASFENAGSPQTILLKNALSTDEYYDLLSSADVVLIPYHRDIYRARTSGIFLEATTAGKMVICTEDTWMDDLLKDFQHGIAIPDRSAGALALAFEQASERLGEFLERAKLAKEHFGKFHTPTNLISHLLSPASSQSALSRRSALIIYPWGDAIDGKAGAATLLHLRARYLAAHYDEVRIFFTGRGDGRISENVFATSYNIDRWNRHWLRWGLELFTSHILRHKREAAFQLWYHIWPKLDSGFKAKCKEMIEQADDVYLEYSYFAPVVDKHCRALGKPYILTQHDILSAQSKGVPIINSLTEKFEFSALRLAPKVLVLNEKDRDECVRHGIPATAVPAAPDTTEYDFLSAEDATFIVEEFLNIKIGGKAVFFFVGSAYPPNVKAAQVLRKIAKKYEADSAAGHLLFVVAGSCLGKSATGNFHSLGKIEGVALAALYRIGAIVAIPIEEGTGTSIKAIEALANGNLVLSTSLGIRGTDAVAGVHCLVEDRIENFPARILEIANRLRHYSTVRQQGHDLGKTYDLQNVFQVYRLAGAKEKSNGLQRESAGSTTKFAELISRALERDEPRLAVFLKSRIAPTKLDQDTLRLWRQLQDASDCAAPSRLTPFGPTNFPPPRINVEASLKTWLDGLQDAYFEQVKRDVSDMLLAADRSSTRSIPALRQFLWERLHAGEIRFVAAATRAVFSTWPDLDDAEIHYLAGLSTLNGSGPPQRAREHLDRALEAGFTCAGWTFFHRGNHRLSAHDRGGYRDLLNAMKHGGKVTPAVLMLLFYRLRRSIAIKLGLRKPYPAIAGDPHLDQR